MGDGVSRRTAVGGGNSTEASSLVDGLVLDVTRALFSNYGVPLELDDTPVSSTLQSAQLVSVIGFSSHTFNGSLLLALPNGVVERTIPTPGASLIDWGGELANQLLGRLKNRLIDYQVSIDMTLPVVIAGERFALPAKTRPVTRYFSFASEWGRFFVRLEAEISPNVELVRQAAVEGSQVLAEGELLLF